MIVSADGSALDAVYPDGRMTKSPVNWEWHHDVDRPPVPGAVAVLAGVAAVPFLFGAMLGTSALQEDSDGGVGYGLVATLALAIAAWEISIMVDRLRTARPPASWPASVPAALWIAAGLGLATGVYVVFSAAPGGPSYSDSWGEVLAGMGGLWIGLSALRAVAPHAMWAFVLLASAALIAASAALIATQAVPFSSRAR